MVITWGTAAIAGDEENGTLELMLAHAVSRTQLVLERTLAAVLRLAWLAAAFLGLGLLSGTLGIAVGALTGRRIYSTAAASGIARLGWVLNAIGNQSKNLAHLRDFSPYGWAYHHTPLPAGPTGAGSHCSMVLASFSSS